MSMTVAVSCQLYLCNDRGLWLLTSHNHTWLSQSLITHINLHSQLCLQLDGLGGGRRSTQALEVARNLNFSIVFTQRRPFELCSAASCFMFIYSCTHSRLLWWQLLLEQLEAKATYDITNQYTVYFLKSDLFHNLAHCSLFLKDRSFSVKAWWYQKQVC